ncbi:AraC-type DNA-binding protein [Actinopolymorpha singaporensis]|uniref:AraC-type DNA-binding protein n=1 Tax=Actinopolymorpha singaporensis TaxID=117157 RepID=A0A1H1LHZ3_9ACTN|nr:AraC-type DNA-binding protein [Actinopolymorpha singaporensis]
MQGLHSTRGILHAREGLRRFELRRRLPSPAVAGLVSHYWIVCWDLRGQPPHTQRVLSYPCVNLVFQADRSRVAGVLRTPHPQRLAGAGRVLGVMFRPGGFRPLLGRSVATITDRFLPLAEVFGVEGDEAAAAVAAAPDDDGMVAAAEEFLARHVARIREGDASTLPVAERVAELVDVVAADPSILRVDQLATRVGLGIRALQRLCAEYAGVGPKWVIRRYRLHEAVQRAAEDHDPDWVRLAADLGYSDQAHLVRDFTAATGQSPTRYARATRLGS